MAVRNYRDRIVWQKVMDLVVAVYALAEELPKAEAFGLAGQMRRAVISIAVNIAEGEVRDAVLISLPFSETPSRRMANPDPA